MTLVYTVVLRDVVSKYETAVSDDWILAYTVKIRDKLI